MANLSNINNKFLVTTGGNVGIGTTSPSQKLHVEGLALIKNNTSGLLYLYDTSNSIYGDINGVGIVNAGNNLRLSTVGTERMRITSGGNVGIGTTSPDCKLTVADSGSGGVNPGTISSNTVATFRRTGGVSHNANISILAGTSGASILNFGDRDNEDAGIITYTHDAGGSDTMAFTVGTIERMRIINSGNVGIGTTSPDYKLEVQGVISSADSGLQKSTFANVGNDLVLTANADATNVTANILFKSSGSGGAAVSEKMRIRSSGTIGIGSGGFDSQMLTIAAGTLDGAIYATSTDANCFASFRDSSSTANIEYGAIGNAHVFRKDATESMRIDGNGRVGIGTTSPTSQLHIKNTSGDNRGILVDNTVAASYAEVSVKSDTREFRLGTGGSNTAANAADVFYVYDATTGGVAGHRFEISSAGEVQARRPRSNTAGEVGLGVQPTDTTAHYGWRIDQTSNNLNLDYVGTPLNIMSYSTIGNVGITATAYLGFNGAGDASHSVGYNAGIDGAILRGQNGIVFGTGGGATAAEKMRITSSGNVGIGTASPVHNLQLGSSGAIAIHSSYDMFSAGAFGVLYRNNYDSYIAGNTQYTASGWVNKYGGTKSVVIGMVDGAINFEVGTGTTAGAASSLSRVVTMANSGKVGIGTTSPETKLEVRGSIASGTGTAATQLTYDTSGLIRAFVHNFNEEKNTASARNVTFVDVSGLGNFHQAMFYVQYGTRLQSVSDATTGAVVRTYGVNRFNGGTLQVTETNAIAGSSNSVTHALITVEIVSNTQYRLRVEFSSTLGPSSFVTGLINGFAVGDSFPTITFAEGAAGM